MADDNLEIFTSAVGDTIVLSVAAPQLPEVLSESECAVSRALFAGLNNAEIAAVRGTAVKTVANQLNSAYHKLGVRSRDQLVARLLGLE